MQLRLVISNMVKNFQKILPTCTLKLVSKLVIDSSRILVDRHAIAKKNLW